MRKARNDRVKDRVKAYDDRGFLGDYARDLPANVAEPLGNAIYAIGRKAYLSQVTRDGLSFQNELVKQVNDIYEKNRDDPAGYAQDFDGMVGEIARNGRPQLAERTKREHMVSIAQNVEEENYHASRQIIHDLMVQTMNGMEVPVQLLSSGDGAVRDMGRDGLKRLISSTVDAMATVDGDGNPLIAPKDVAMFLQRFNGNVRQGSMAGWLARCRTVDDVDRVVTMVASGKLVVPQYSVDPSSRNVEERYDALNISDSTGGEGEYMRSMVEKRKFDIVRDGVTARQLAVLRDTTDHTMVRGTTQPSADAWFMDYRDVISDTVGRGEDPKPIIQYLASRMDRVPSQVVATIRGAVASGDNAAIQVAAPYLMAWHDENPAALARAFQDDGMTLISMFSLANQLSTASTTQTGVRERTLKSFSFQTRGREDQQSSYDRLISDHVDDSMLTNLVASWENNREIRKDFGTPGDFQDVEETSLSPFFLAALRDQFRGYLEDSGGDLAAATRMMESAISTIGVSRLGTVPSPSMPYCPENYPGVADRESIAHAIESMGKKWYNDAMANGDMPDGSEYVGTFLLSDDITARQAEDIDFSLSRGIDHMVSDEGKKIFCPSYAQMITFSFGGLVHFIPVGRFNPSLHIPDGQKTKEPGGAS